MTLFLNQIAEAAAFVSSQALSLIESPAAFPRDALQHFWTCSRGRAVQWQQSLDLLSSELSTARSNEEQQQFWQTAQPLIEEIFATEILTRVWATVLTAFDLQHGSDQTGSVANNVFKSHLEARVRACHLLLETRIPYSTATALDRLRRKCERWSDVLCGPLALNFQIDEFTFDSDRALEFGESQVREVLRATEGPAWEILLAGLRLSFRDLTKPGISDTWNRGIVRAVLSSFPLEALASTEGRARCSTWSPLRDVPHDSDRLDETLQRLLNATDQSPSTTSDGQVFRRLKRRVDGESRPRRHEWN